MDIAVRYEKIDLGYDKFLFKPVGIVKGIYNKTNNTFETEYGEICASIGGESKYSDSYFGGLTSLFQLKKIYPTESEEYLLTKFYDECSLFCTIGYYDYENTKIRLIHIPYDELEKVIMDTAEEKIQQELAEQKENLEIPQQEMLINFTIDDLKKIRNSRDIKEVREKIDSVLEYASLLTDTFIDVEDKNEIELEKKRPDPSTEEKVEIKKQADLIELRKTVKSIIKGQDKAVDDITRAIDMNLKSKNPEHKGHLLIMGPTGTGKTKTISIIAEKLGIPYYEADSTAYTKEGYVGKSIYSMFTGLIAAADGDIKKAENGILIMDEIDKKISDLKDDVGGVAVLYSLLKILDGTTIEIEQERGKIVRFNTSNLTVVFMGAFSEIYKKKYNEKKNKQKNRIGFGIGSEQEKTEEEKIEITPDDLISAGMPAEYIGRIPYITSTDELSVERLVEILYKSKSSAITEEKEFFKDLGVTIKFTKGYMEEIAKQAKESKTNARGLRKLVKKSVCIAYDEVSTNKKIKELKFTKQTALDNTKYFAK